MFYSRQKFPWLLCTAKQFLLCNCNALADPPRFDAEELEAFKAPVTVKKGHKAAFKLPYIGRDPIKVQWYLDGEELSDESNIKLEYSDGYTRLLLMKLQRKDSGEVKIRLKNEFGTVEALSQLVVLGMYANAVPLHVFMGLHVYEVTLLCWTLQTNPLLLWGLWRLPKPPRQSLISSGDHQKTAVAAR